MNLNNNDGQFLYVAANTGSLIYTAKKDPIIYFHLGGIAALASATDTLVLLHPYCPHGSSCLGTILEGYTITSSTLTTLYYKVLGQDWYSTNGVRIAAFASSTLASSYIITQGINTIIPSLYYSLLSSVNLNTGVVACSAYLN